MTKIAVFAASLVVGMGLGLPMTYAESPQTISGTDRIEIDQVISLSQLRNILQQRGYTDIQLSPIQPNDMEPRPDITYAGWYGQRPTELERTAVHCGWNGTAMRNTKRVSIVLVHCV
jgi:hypothetical protein